MATPSLLFSLESRRRQAFERLVIVIGVVIIVMVAVRPGAPNGDLDRFGNGALAVYIERASGVCMSVAFRAADQERVWGGLDVAKAAPAVPE